MPSAPSAPAGPRRASSCSGVKSEYSNASPVSPFSPRSAATCSSVRSSNVSASPFCPCASIAVVVPEASVTVMSAPVSVCSTFAVGLTPS